MPTPKFGYWSKIDPEEEFPGTTKIIGRFKESGALMQWAFKQGKAGKRHLYEETEKAADIGTVVHAAVEQYIEIVTPTTDRPEDEMLLAGLGEAAGRVWIRDSKLDDSGKVKAVSAFEAYLKWSQNFKVRPIAQEVQLVSEKHKFGGTPDLIAIVGNALALIDFKTSSGIYTDYLVQVAAYGALWNENHPEQPITGGYHILRFSKENADFGHYHFPNLDEAWEQFLLFRRAFDIDKELKRRAA